MRKGDQDPFKTTINLAQRERRNANFGAVLPVAIALAVFIGLFCKWGVIDRLNKVTEMERRTAETQQLLQQAQAKTKDYNSVREKYESSTAVQTGGVDPMRCLTMLEEYLLDDAAVSSFSVSGSTISVKLFNVTLNQISAVYTRLKADPLVSGVRVYTAQTGSKNAEKVTASMTIRMVSSGTDSREEAS